MKAWRISDWGEPETMAIADVPEPEPAAGQSLVEVEAAALNFSDLLMIRGAYQVRPDLPFTPGQEVAGTVVRPAPGSAFKAGDRIASKVFWGGFAERVAVPDEMMIAIPGDMPAAEAAALPVVYTTAWIALHHRAGLQKGETVLVHAAAGGVGHAAVQIAAAAGARVLATAGGPEKLALARAAGAADAVDYHSEDWVEAIRQQTGGAGADVIFDPVGGTIATQSLRCIAWGGRLLIVGFASGDIPELSAARLLIKNASALGVYWSHDRDLPLVNRVTAAILDLYADGKIKPLVGARYPFEQAPAALADLDRRRTTGKVILEIGR